MYSWRWTLVGFLVVAGCGSQHLVAPALSPERGAVVDREVREFVAAVARDVTEEGPAAWRRHFSESPAFFMASEGHLQFPDSNSAIAGIQGLTRIIKHIELEFRDVRIDPLTPELAVVGASWREATVDAADKRVEDNGYFTGIAEHRNGRWQFRNAHWSVAATAPAVR